MKNIARYKDRFTPKLVEYELKKRFRKKFVFVSDMGDLFGDWVHAREAINPFFCPETCMNGQLIRKGSLIEECHICMNRSVVIEDEHL